MKITILKNGIQNQDSFNQGIQIIKDKLASVKFPAEIAIKEISQVFTGVATTSTTIANGVCVDPGEILAQVDGSEDVVALIFDWEKVLPKPTNPCHTGIKKGNATPIQIPEEWYGSPTSYPEVFAEFFLHEFCHATYFLLGLMAQDMTHLMTNRTMNPTLYDQWSSKQPIDFYAYLLTTLLPQWNAYKTPQSIQVPTITITRSYLQTETLGDAVAQYNGKTSRFNTLELPNKQNQRNISCIPEGTYQVRYVFKVLKFGWIYEIQNVPNRSGILMHAGNYFYDSEGCIIVGSGYSDINKDGAPDILNSRATLSAMVSFMNKQPFTLIIKS